MIKIISNKIAFTQAKESLLAGQKVRICVQGQSMLPFFRSGSKITLRPVRPEDLRCGRVVLAETASGLFVVHRIIGITKSEIILLGDGNVAGTETMPHEKVYGIVDCNFVHRTLAHVWFWMRPIRKYPLYFLKRLSKK
ncbi:MAG: S24/S26 family peptidase [Alistipes sp.]